MIFVRLSLPEVLYVLAFSLAFSTSSIKTFALLSGADFAPIFYIGAGLASVLVFSMFLILFASVRLWNRPAEPICQALG